MSNFDWCLCYMNVLYSMFEWLWLYFLLSKLAVLPCRDYINPRVQKGKSITFDTRLMFSYNFSSYNLYSLFSFSNLCIKFDILYVNFFLWASKIIRGKTYPTLELSVLRIKNHSAVNTLAHYLIDNEVMLSYYLGINCLRIVTVIVKIYNLIV